MAFVYPVRIRFVDTDASGRIHFTAMLRHFEAVEQEFFRSVGLAYSAPLMLEFGLPRVHVECDFMSLVQFDDLVTITMTVERIGSTSFTLAFNAAVEERQVARGKLVIVCVDVVTGRSRPLPDAFVQVLKAHVVAT